ncbi:tetratricopeptide repeat protein [Streptomyces sp. NPDC058718]|uniref:tetratricopeptide repeat protein n=1 Tax=Streptomyces sp. NPDC058718 TaxID=3346610 RepID=UPI0036CEBF37
MTTAVSPWGFKGTLVGQLSSELATAKEALRSSRAEDCARITRRLVTEIAAVQAAADGTEEQQRLQLIHASALTILGRAEQGLSPPDGLARFEDAVRIFSRAVHAGADLRRDELADYGSALGGLGRLEEAEQFVTQALERDTPVPAEVVLGIADLLSRRSEQASADRLLNLALDAGAEDPAIAERLGRSLQEASQPDRAADAFTQAGMWFGAGRTPDEALRCFDLALALVSDHIGAMIGRSYALHDLGRHEEALAAVEHTLERHPASAEAQAYAAQLLGSLGRVEEAFRLLEDGFTHSGEVPELRAALARVLLSAGSAGEALTVVEALLAELPTDVELRRLKARILRHLDRPEAAIEILSGLLAENAAIPDDRLDMIDTVIGMGEYERALTETEHALLFVPENPGLLGRRALILTQLERFEEALDAASHAVALDRSEPTALQAEGVALFQLGRAEDALQPFRRLLSLSADSFDIRQQVIDLLINLGRLDEADSLVAEGLRIHGEDPRLLTAQGHIAIRREAYEDALAPLETAALRLEETAEAEADKGAAAGVYLWLGEAMRMLGRNTEAHSYLERGLVIRPDSGWLLGTLGQVLRAAGSGAAEETLRRSVESEDSPSFAYAELGDLLREKGQLAKSREVLTAGIERWPDDAWIWGSLSATQYLLKNYEAALTSCDKALSHNSAYAWAWALKGAVLMDTDQLPQAVGALDAALDLEPANAWAWMLRGWTLEMLGRRADARQSFKNANSHQGSADRQEETWASIGLADLLLQDGDSEGARRQFEQVLKVLRGVDGTELAQIGWCHLRLDECEQAAREFGEALPLEEPFSPVQFDLALALLGLEPVERAVDAYAEAVVTLRDVAHAGRRSFLLHVAEHDLDVVLNQPGFRKVEPENVDVIRWMLARDGPAAPEWREAVEGKLRPAKYHCTLHGTDLTDKVAQRLSSNPVRVVNFGFSVRRGKRARKDEPFTVVVACPGSGQGEHDHEFKGVVTP